MPTHGGPNVSHSPEHDLTVADVTVEGSGDGTDASGADSTDSTDADSTDANASDDADGTDVGDAP